MYTVPEFEKTKLGGREHLKVSCSLKENAHTPAPQVCSRKKCVHESVAD